jgi:hypothetical protein
VQRPREHHAVLRAHFPWLPARARRPPSTLKLHRTGQPRGPAGQGLDIQPCLADPVNLVGPLGSFIGALPDLHAAEHDIIAEQQATQAVFTGFLDRSVLYGVLAHMETLDLVEVQRVTKTERHPARVTRPEVRGC